MAKEQIVKNKYKSEEEYLNFCSTNELKAKYKKVL